MSLKILVLGSTGFVGRNIAECLTGEFTLIRTSRDQTQVSNDVVYFDLFNKESWQQIIDQKPDIIINSAAYGVVKLQQDLDPMYKINYFLISEFHQSLVMNNCSPYWMQIGTAFEYDLSGDAIDEQTPCLPKTHYGISKLMMSNFLQSQAEKNNFTILRPFGMFGKYEDGSKFFPYLINAQKTKNLIDLSPGTQQRDYFYVKDLGLFIKDILLQKTYNQLPPVMNLGSGGALSFRDYASILQDEIPGFDPSLWNWGKVAFRKGESEMFYSASTIGSSFGFKVSPLRDGFKETANYYLNIV